MFERLYYIDQGNPQEGGGLQTGILGGFYQAFLSPVDAIPPRGRGMAQRRTFILTFDEVYKRIPALHANMDEAILPVVITERAENRNPW